MSFIHQRTTKAKAEELLQTSDGEYTNGHCLLRAHAKKADTTVLSIVYKGAPTHHVMAPNEDGVFTVNSKVYGDTNPNDLVGLIKVLLTKPKGWPVQLTKVVMPDKSRVDPSDAVSSGGGGGGGKKKSGGGGGPVWLHPKMDKATADGLIGEGDDATGHFLVRTVNKAEGRYVLSVVYKGKPTHHKVVKGDDGTFSVNNKPMGTATDLQGLLDYLKTKPKGWPAKLTDGIPVAGASKSNKSSSGGGGGGAAKPKKAKSKGKKSKSQKPLWVHGELDKEQAKALLSEKTNGEFTAGAFLFRKRTGPGYTLSVCFKGKDTHHTVQRVSKEHPWKVGKHDIEGSVSIVDVYNALKTKKSWWPVPLTIPIEREVEGGASTEVEAEDNNKAEAAAVDATANEAEANEGEGDGDETASDQNESETKDGDVAADNADNADNAADNADNTDDAASTGGAVDNVPDVSSVDYNVAKNYDAETDVASVTSTALHALPHKKDVAKGNVLEITIVKVNGQLGFGVACAWLGVDNGHVNMVSTVVETSPAHGKLEVGDEILYMDRYSYEGKDIEDLKDGLKDSLDSIDIVFYRRHTKYEANKGYSDPLPDVECMPSKQPNRMPSNTGTLTFNHKGKYHRRAEKCGESMYCHCEKCYTKQLEDKRQEMQQFLTQAERGNERLNIHFSSKDVSRV